MRGLKLHGAFTFHGVGGQEMLGQGLVPFFDISELNVMGVVDVIKQLPKLLARVKSTAEYIIDTAPDVVVLVDFQDFSALLAKRLRKQGFDGPIVLCVAPSVWAWRSGRAKKLNGIFDEVLAVLPFEPKVMATLGGPDTTYIGHPAVGKYTVVAPPSKGKLLLLPGSRRGEVRRHMSLFRKVAEQLIDHPAITGMVLPTFPRLEELVRSELQEWPVNVDVLVDQQSQEVAYADAVVALACSGTIALELALRGVPFVGTYVPDAFQVAIYYLAGRPLLLLPNIMAEERVVREELFGPRVTHRIVSGLSELIDEADVRQTQLAAFDEIRHMLEFGTRGAKKHDAADRILQYLK